MDINRPGERIGWIGGWLGGFLWVLILALVFLFQGKSTAGIVGLVLAGLGAFYIFANAPWKSPATPYWKLMLRPYAVLLTAVAWAVWAFGGWRSAGLSWWNLFWIPPLFTPFFIIGRRTWNQFGERNEHE
ncbi:MAG: hypothetical protein JXO51_05815 [Candidatus Aminicenantes bacterium]|nr:hypothetical protein [Candidatus Aminicenantes bacterium]